MVIYTEMGVHIMRKGGQDEGIFFCQSTWSSFRKVPGTILLLSLPAGEVKEN